MSRPQFLQSSRIKSSHAVMTAAKKSVWLKRRIVVLQDAVTLGEIAPEHVPESDMVADIFAASGGGRKTLREVKWAPDGGEGSRQIWIKSAPTCRRLRRRRKQFWVRRNSKNRSRLLLLLLAPSDGLGGALLPLLHAVRGEYQ